MVMTVSEHDQVVIPGSLSRQLGLKTGDKFEAEIKNGEIVVSPQTRPRYTTRIITSPITGLPVLTSGPNAPILTSEMVEEILSDFP